MIISERDSSTRRISRTRLNYAMKKEVGSGTFGKVFEAMRGGARYAIKKFTYAKEAYHLTTLREIKALRAIKSRYVLQIKEVVVESFQIYLVFDFYDYDLYRLIGVENFTLCDIKHIFWQALKGVKAIHDRGYLHRDLKTANILIGKTSGPESDASMHRDPEKARSYTKRYCRPANGGCDVGQVQICEGDGKGRCDEAKNAGAEDLEPGGKLSEAIEDRMLCHPDYLESLDVSSEEYPHTPSRYEVRICDFGMSRQRSKEMTQGVVTLWYRAPELLLGSTVYTKAIDVWSLGCILLELLWKRPILKANTEVESLEMIADLCGTINEASMPGCDRYPLYPKYNLKEGTRCIIERFSMHSQKAADLADRMLVLNPEKRISIEECFQHPFFKSP